MIEWVQEIEDNRDQLIAYFGSHDLPNWAEPDDVVQEVYLDMIRSYTGKLPPLDTARSTGIRIIRKMLRKERGESSNGPRTMVSIEREVTITNTSLTTRAFLVQGDQAHLGLRLDLIKALEQLPDIEKSVLWYTYMEGYERKEIAEFLDVPPTHVKYLVSKASSKLRGIIGEP